MITTVVVGQDSHIPMITTVVVGRAGTQSS
jgi:hypothetical protein